MLRRWSVLVAALLVAPALAACSGSDGKPDAPSATPTPIAKLDVAGIRLARAKFCDRLPASAVRRALGAPATDDQHWGSGDPVPGTAGSGDLGHEFGCAWTGPAGAAARAWVFARPVDAAFATTLVGQSGQAEGCTGEATPTFGNPALLQTCTLADGTQRVRRAGLFGDTWLTCEVAGPAAPDLPARTDAWCATAVAALDMS
jgi:hypothetical protein